MNNPEPWNASAPIDVTEAGMVIPAKLIQFVNAITPIDVTESGIAIDVKLELPNAEISIVLTVFGIVNVEPGFLIG
jgi:hypothetical protein